MTTTFKLCVPKEATATVTITASVGDLTRLLQQIDNLRGQQSNPGWPLTEFLNDVDKVIRAAHKEFAEYSEEMP